MYKQIILFQLNITHKIIIISQETNIYKLTNVYQLIILSVELILIIPHYNYFLSSFIARMNI